MKNNQWAKAERLDGADRIMGIYCDCNSRGGVWSYTLRTLHMFKRWGWRTTLFSHHARNETQQEILNALMAAADETLLIDESQSDDRQIRVLQRALLGKHITLFIPNYKKFTYAAAALVTRKQNLAIVGVCHADHVSYYEVLRRYQDIISVFVCASRKTTKELNGYLSERNKDKNRHIPHYIQFDVDGRADFSEAPFTVIYHGRVREEQKRCSEILRVAQLACRENPNIRFVLMGDGGESEYYNALIANLNLADHVTIQPSSPWLEVQASLLDSQLAILTSEFEGFCYGVAEAMVAGLPVAAYNCGDVISDFVIDGKTGRLADWGNAAGLAEWIVALSKDRDAWSGYSDAARELATTSFGIDRVSELYADALFGVHNTTRAWPLTRPAFIPVKGKSFRSFLERVGTRLGAWG